MWCTSNELELLDIFCAWIEHTDAASSAAIAMYRFRLILQPNRKKNLTANNAKEDAKFANRVV